MDEMEIMDGSILLPGPQTLSHAKPQPPPKVRPSENNLSLISKIYQGNDEIQIHIACQVSRQDAEKESTIANRLKRTLTSIIPRKRKVGIQSGLTVDRYSGRASAKPKDAKEDLASLTALQDVFLPAIKTFSQTDTTTVDTGAEHDVDSSGARITRGREVFGFQTQRKPTGLKSLIEQQQHMEYPQPKQQINLEESAAADKEAKRRRFVMTVSKMNNVNSGDEDEDEQESDDGSDLGDDQKAYKGDFDDTVVHDANNAQKSFFEEDEMGTERYFQNLYQKSRTSNNTLSKLPTLEHADFIQAIKRTPTKHSKEMEMLNVLYEEQFPQWYFELMAGFNLLIYGYGSKRLLLTKFATSTLTDAPLIIVNGYFPTLTIKEILDKISSGALQYSGSTGTLQEQLAFIHAYFAQPDRVVQKLYLLIHNIDGSSLRSEKTQSALSLLASCPHVHLVASMDHINTNILWDTVKAARFRWVWHELTTFKPYLTETSFENSIMVRQGDLGPRGIQFVLASLTSNGKGLFRILAEHQIQVERDAVGGGTSVAGNKNHADWGMAYNTLFKKCQENFLVSNAVTFKTQLTEFRDHRIVHSKKGQDGVEILYIPLSASILEGILDQMT
ncbi:Origin recognition complex subunit 2 [Modicella reniformis]|uniref:Origin recognition complex subunit 2 n=1 Tax=Modicella reniformis TaxID=1440133 RepID=A0A9P6MBS4_9FUNG|nr:Origin recognition complex subunit 2 [Modicella reniformis]